MKKLETCIQNGTADEYLATTEALARSLNIQSVPAIFIENDQIVPPNTLEGWEEILHLQS